jgi:hypothetical protein
MSKPAGYAVGWGRPPLATRFQKGNTAARGRRKRREKSFVTLLLEALAEPVADVAADGDRQAIKLVLGVVLALERRGSFEPEEPPHWAPADKAVVENLRELFRAP